MLCWRPEVLVITVSTIFSQALGSNQLTSSSQSTKLKTLSVLLAEEKTRQYFQSQVLIEANSCVNVCSHRNLRGEQCTLNNVLKAKCLEVKVDAFNIIGAYNLD